MKAKEFETKPRNFVAKNAKMGGAGQHKDKKKAEKQGDIKHKQKLVPMETIEQKLARKIQENLDQVVAESKFDPINDDDYYEYNVNTKEIVNHISGKHPEARRFNPLQRVWPGRDEDHKIVRGLTAKYLKKDMAEDKAGWSDNSGTVKKYEPTKKGPMPSWRLNKDGTATDKNTGITYNRDGSVVKKEEGVGEGMFGIDSKTKGAIQNVVSKLSDIPGMWDHAAQTFTDDGMDKLKAVLKNNPKYVKYAVNLTADDFETEAAPAAVRAAGGAALGALSGVGGALIGQMFAPFIGATAGGIAGAVSGYKVGADATDALWDKVSSMFGGAKEAQQAGIVHAKAAAKGEKTFNYDGKEYPVKLKSTDASSAAKAVNQVANGR